MEFVGLVRYPCWRWLEFVGSVCYPCWRWLEFVGLVRYPCWHWLEFVFTRLNMIIVIGSFIFFPVSESWLVQCEHDNYFSYNSNLVCWRLSVRCELALTKQAGGASLKKIPDQHCSCTAG